MCISLNSKGAPRLVCTTSLGQAVEPKIGWAVVADSVISILHTDLCPDTPCLCLLFSGIWSHAVSAGPLLIGLTLSETSERPTDTPLRCVVYSQSMWTERKAVTVPSIWCSGSWMLQYLLRSCDRSLEFSHPTRPRLMPTL